MIALIRGSWQRRILDCCNIQERFVIVVNGWKPLIITTKRSILDAGATLDPPLVGMKVSVLTETYLGLHQTFII